MDLKNIDDCVDIINGAKSDTEKFASLLIAAKLLQRDRCNEENRSKVFEAVGFTFLKRLWKTEKIDEGCTKWTYKSLAVSILSCFCLDPNLVVHPEMLANIRDFNTIIVSISGESENIEEQNLINDTFDCLTNVAGHPAGIDALVKEQTVCALCQAVSNKCYGWQKAQQLILYMINVNGSDTWNDNTDGLHLILQYFVQMFKSQQDENKFGVCSTIYIILSSVRKDQLEKIQNNQWCDELQESVFVVLQSKLASNHRELVLKLACTAVGLLGVDWTLSKEDKQRKFLLILVHLCCIEVRMCLESENFDQIEQKADLLCSSYLLLENVISYMTAGESLSLDDKQVQQLHSAMLGAFNSVLQFLENVQSLPTDKQENNFTVASIRVLGSWIAEETSALQDKVISLIPFLLKLGKKAFDESNNHTDPESPSDKEPLEDILKFLLPGLCHLSSEETAREVFLREKGHELLGQYFSKQYSLLLNEDGQVNSEAQVALTTLCGVFLNLVVMEPDLVAVDRVFSELLSFLITIHPNLAEKESNLILAYNMSVLGLMLLRHYSNNLQVTNSDCDKFYKSTISLLWCHEYEEDNGQCFFVLKEKQSQAWADINELWFLGMQAFSACIPLFPNIPIAILRSGWIPNILKTFIKVQGEYMNEIIRRSYCDFILQLALQGGEVINVIREKGGVEFAQLYRYPSLEKCLNTE